MLNSAICIYYYLCVDLKHLLKAHFFEATVHSDYVLSCCEWCLSTLFYYSCSPSVTSTLYSTFCPFFSGQCLVTYVFPCGIIGLMSLLMVSHPVMRRWPHLFLLPGIQCRVFWSLWCIARSQVVYCKCKQCVCVNWSCSASVMCCDMLSCQVKCLTTWWHTAAWRRRRHEQNLDRYYSGCIKMHDTRFTRLENNRSGNCYLDWPIENCSSWWIRCVIICETFSTLFCISFLQFQQPCVYTFTGEPIMPTGSQKRHHIDQVTMMGLLNS